jgi:GxxExxY protein
LHKAAYCFAISTGSAPGSAGVSPAHISGCDNFTLMHINTLTERVIAAAIEVHRTLGPGLLESVYQECLCKELESRGIAFIQQANFPIEFKGSPLDSKFRLDLLVENTLVIEIKSVEAILPVHEAQILTYMKLGGWNVGLLINFNVALLKQGIRRKVLKLSPDQDLCISHKK